MPAALVRYSKSVSTSAPGGEAQGARAGAGAAGRAGRSEIERQRDVVGADAVVAHGDVDLPHFRVVAAAPHADLAQSDVFDGVGDGDDAQILGEGDGGIERRGAAGADERDLADAAAILPLNVAREEQRLVEVERGGSGLRGGDRGLDFLAVELEGRGRGGQRRRRAPA